MIWLQSLLSHVVTGELLWHRFVIEMDAIRRRSELTNPPVHQVFTQERKHGHGPQASKPPCFFNVAPDRAIDCMTWPKS